MTLSLYHGHHPAGTHLLGPMNDNEDFKDKKGTAVLGKAQI